jgi:hypothetical protein
MARSIVMPDLFHPKTQLTGQFSKTFLFASGSPNAFIAAGNPLSRHGSSAKQRQKS